MEGLGPPGPMVVHLCVDSMAARKSIVETVPDGALEGRLLLVDSRMGALYSRTVCVWDPDTKAAYLRDWYSDESAAQEPCTMRSTAFMAKIGAGIAVGTAALWLGRKQVPVVRDLGLHADGWKPQVIGGVP
mgnify:CR=1 FL=1